MKELGVAPGVHDIHLVYKAPHVGSGYATIELKVGSNKQSDYQRDFSSKMDECGHRSAVCYTVKEVRDTLVSWGLTCKNTVCIEPPPTEAEKRAFVAKMYKPLEKNPVASDKVEGFKF